MRSGEELYILAIAFITNSLFAFQTSSITENEFIWFPKKQVKTSWINSSYKKSLGFWVIWIKPNAIISGMFWIGQLNNSFTFT